MEKFSKKRGRPSFFSDEYKAAMRKVWPEGGERTFNNRLWWQHAFSALHDQKGLDWLLETNPQGDYKRGTLLSELGRLQNPDLIKGVAKTICEQKPKVKDGIVMIRAYRQALQGKQPPAPDPLALANEIINTLNDYLLRYPETTDEQIRQALNTALKSVI